MKLHNLEQGTQEWLDLRANYFTASQAPAMMGACKYKSRYQLLKELKTGIAKPFNRYAADIGHERERTAMNEIIDKLGVFVTAEVVTNEIEGLPLLASLDGAALPDFIIEHKSLNADLRKCSSYDDLHPMYKIQIQQQLLVAECEKEIFVASNGSLDGSEIWIECSADKDMQKAIIEGWKLFKKDLEEFTPNEPQVDHLFDELHQKRLLIKDLQDEEKILISQITEFGETESEKGKCIKVVRKGSVDYKKIPELDGVDLNAYRKPDSSYFKITTV